MIRWNIINGENSNFPLSKGPRYSNCRTARKRRIAPAAFAFKCVTDERLVLVRYSNTWKHQLRTHAGAEIDWKNIEQRYVVRLIKTSVYTLCLSYIVPKAQKTFGVKSARQKNEREKKTYFQMNEIVSKNTVKLMWDNLLTPRVSPLDAVSNPSIHFYFYFFFPRRISLLVVFTVLTARILEEKKHCTASR